MPARKQRIHPDHVKERIQASQLINRLTQFVNSEINLEPAQVTAALGLLRKCGPDLAAVQHSGADGGPLQVIINKFSDAKDNAA